MGSLTYLSVFEHCDDGSYSVFFPDLPGCVTCGRTYDVAVKMAGEALSLHLYGCMRNGEVLPAPSVVLSSDDTQYGTVVPITVKQNICENLRVRSGR